MRDGLMILLAYLLGATPFSYLIVRALRGIDVRTVGSGNAGATNVLRAAGKGPAILALALDVGKGAAAVLLARWLGASPTVVCAVGVAAVVGHIYPVWLGFRGGKGVATAIGTLLSLAFLPTLVSLLLLVAVVATTRYVSLGSMVAVGTLPLWIALGGALGWIDSPWVAPLLGATVAIAALVIFKHRENIGRLRAGTESRLGRSASENEP